MSNPEDVPKDGDDAVNEVSFDIATEKKVLQLSKNQLKKLGLTYKKEPTEKEKERNERLRQMQKERHEKFRKEKEEYEKKQLEELAKKVVVKDKPKQRYRRAEPPTFGLSPSGSSSRAPVKPGWEYSDDTDVDSEDADYREYMKFKIAKAKAAKVQPKSKIPTTPEQSDDERIQKKKEKAKELIDTVQKIDKTINQIYKNPYLDLFNKK